jgi:hypothetical protein
MLSMPDTTLHAWVRRGWVQARQEPETQRWILWADTSEVERLRQRRAVPAGHYSHQRWLDTALPAAHAHLTGELHC